MSKTNHLRKIVQILRDHHEEEIRESGDWFWNLKDWTINFVTNYDFESVIAYKVKDGHTAWSEYITLEKRSKEWVELI